MKLIQIGRYFINPDNVTAVYDVYDKARAQATAVDTTDGRGIKVRMDINEVVALLTEQKGEHE